MTFICPGCKQSLPLGEGQLIYEATSQKKHRKARTGVNAYQARPGEIVVAIMCAPCTADLVLARAGISR